MFFEEMKLGSKKVGDGQIRRTWFSSSKERCQVLQWGWEAWPSGRRRRIEEAHWETPARSSPRAASAWLCVLLSEFGKSVLEWIPEPTASL